MIIKDIKYIPCLKNFKLIAGEGGLNRHIRNAVIFEYEDKKDYEPDYYHDDFIITSLIFAKTIPALADKMLCEMITLGASAIAVKSSYYKIIPDSVIRYANEMNIPIFLFDNIFIEDVIVNMATYMQNERRYALYQGEIRDCINPGHILPESGQLGRIVTSGFKKYMYSAYIKCNPDAGTMPIDRIFTTLTLRKNMSLQKDYQFYQYKNGLFIIYGSTTALSDSALMSSFKNVIEQFGCSYNDYTCGYSECVENPEDYHSLFRESYFSCAYALYIKKNYALYSDMGIYRIIFPMLINEDCIKSLRADLNLLLTGDKSSDNDLMNTLKALCHSDFDIKSAAVTLCQHPNTVRYRIKKALILLHCDRMQELYLKFILIDLYMSDVLTL